MISLENLEAVICARVSDDRDGRSRSTKQQVGKGKQWCARNNIPVAKVVVEDDIGASRYSRKKRTAYEQVLAEDLKPRGGKRRILVSWESSRAQRDLAVYVRLRKVCEDNGALWCYNDRVYDMSDPDDRRRTAQDAVDDEYEVERTRKRILRDMEDTREAGRPHGKLAYGYRIVRNPRTGKSEGRVPDEETKESIAEGRVATAPIVREIARRLLAGEKARGIAMDLERRGVPAPRPSRDGEPIPWRGGLITRMIQSPTYAGRRTHLGVDVGKGAWEALISDKDHERLVALMGNPKRLTHRGTEPRWLLSGIALCGVCGARMKALRPRGRFMYVCGERFCVGRAIEPVERLVEEAILERLESPDVLELLAAHDETAAAAFEQARLLRARLDAFVDQTMDPVEPLSPQALARIEAKLKPQIAAAERQARSAIKSPLIEDLAGGDARVKWAELAVANRRDVVQGLAEITIHKTTRGTRFNPRWISLRWAGEPDPGVPEAVPLDAGGLPQDFTVPEVLAYLRGAGYDERLRVVEAERAGQRRHAIVKLSVDPRRARVGGNNAGG